MNHSSPRRYKITSGIFHALNISDKIGNLSEKIKFLFKKTGKDLGIWIYCFYAKVEIKLQY